MTVAVDHNAPAGAGAAGSGASGGGSGPGAAPAVVGTGQVGKIDPSLPQVFGRYLLVQRLSRGGMGEIFLAKHGLQGFEKLCVIKKVLPNLAEDSQFISRFVDEAQVAIKLQHTNVAQVFEVGRVGDEYFLAIEYVEGRDLRRTLQVMGRQKRRFTPDLALYVAREIANGLAYAHRRTGADGAHLHLVHCDISPPNVLVSFEGETKIIDFGIAKSALRATATDPKMGFGKFGYMAPEQLIRGGVVDHRTDIYAAGVVLFELLTGKRLYELGQENGGSPDYRALARAVSRGEHDLPSDIDPALQPWDELVVKALRPRPEDRYQTAAEFRDAIQTALVQVSPTISADHLGAFLRDVFADEMNAHHELVERVAHMHLDDFREALTTQSVATVSFALANMPLLAPPERAAGPKVAPASGTVAPPAGGTGTVELSDLDLVPADVTLKSKRKPPWPLVAAGAGALVLLIGVIAMASRGSSENRTGSVTQAPAPDPSDPTPQPPGHAQPPPTQPRAQPTHAPTQPPPTQAQPPAPTITTITPLPAQPTATAPEHAAPPPAQPSHDTVARKHPATTPHKDTPRPPRNGDKEARHDEHAAPDAAAVLAKFKAVSREYRQFEKAYGARLDAEWTDLATAAQYADKSPEKLASLERKIEHFRSLMAAQK